MRLLKKIKETIRKIGEAILIFFGIEDPYEHIDYLEYETSKFLDKREKNGRLEKN